MAQRKLNISLEENLIDRMDDFATKKGLNRSALIAVACAQYMDAAEAMPGLNTMLAAFGAFIQTVAEGKLEPGTPEYDAAVEELDAQQADFAQKHPLPGKKCLKK